MSIKNSLKKTKPILKNYKLAPFVETGFVENNLYISFGSKREKIVRPEIQKATLDALLFFRKEQELQVAESYLLEIGHTKKSIQQSLSIIIDKYIHPISFDNIKKNNCRNNSYYSMFSSRPNEIIENLKKSTVSIIGSGHLSSSIVQSLSESGIGKIKVFDDDLKKSKVVEDFFSKTPQSHIKSFATNIKSVVDSNLVIHCSDSQKDALKWNKVCIKNKVPFIRTACVEDILCWGPLLIPGKTGCISCSSKYYVKEKSGIIDNLEKKCEKLNASYVPPEPIFLIQQLSSFLCMDITRFLGKYGEIKSINTRLAFWSNDLKLVRHDHNKNPYCEQCGDVSSNSIENFSQEAIS